MERRTLPSARARRPIEILCSETTLVLSLGGRGASRTMMTTPPRWREEASITLSSNEQQAAGEDPPHIIPLTTAATMTTPNRNPFLKGVSPYGVAERCLAPRRHRRRSSSCPWISPPHCSYLVTLTTEMTVLWHPPIALVCLFLCLPQTSPPSSSTIAAAALMITMSSPPTSGTCSADSKRVGSTAARFRPSSRRRRPSAHAESVWATSRAPPWSRPHYS